MEMSFGFPLLSSIAVEGELNCPAVEKIVTEDALEYVALGMPC